MKKRIGTLVAVFAILTGTVYTGVVLAANQAADLDQCANGQSPSPPTDGCDGTSGTSWVNGNLNASKSVYREGDSIAYRMRFTNIVIGTTIHTVVLEWDTTKGGKHALDYLTSWNRTVSDANPCLGVSGSHCASGATPSTRAIPVDPQAKSGQDLTTGSADDVNPGPDGTTGTGDDATPSTGVFTMWGGTITNVSAITPVGGTGWAGDKSATLTVSFTASVANPVMAWGGHIATRLDWGTNNSAVAISGSPYHMRLIDLDGAGGNQDRSLSADAVIFPGSITVIKDANASGTFNFTASPTPLSNFSLSPTASTDDTKVFSGISVFTNYTITETVPSSWDLTSASCTITSGANGGSVGTTTNGVTINLKEGENVTCTFVNFLRDPALDIVKTATLVNGNASPLVVTKAGDVITYSITVDNTGNIDLTGVTVVDTFCTTGPTYVSGDADSDSKLDVSETWTYSCTHTVTQAEIDNGGNYDGSDEGTAFDSLRNVATADSNETGEDTDDEVVPVNASASLDIVKTATLVNGNASPLVVTKAGDVITYSITVDNTGDVTLTGVTVVDTFCTTGPTYVSGDADSDSKLDVSETWTYSCTHTVTAEELAAGGNFDTNDEDALFDVLRNVATADSNETGEDTDDEVVPVVAAGSIGTEDYFIPQDEVTLSGLTTGASGDLYIALLVGEDPECTPDPNDPTKLDASVTPVWEYTWAGVGNGTKRTADLTGDDAQTVEVSVDSTVMWCTSYSGDAHNAPIAISDRGEFAVVDFNPLTSAAIGASIPLLAWFLWSQRKRRQES
jgi:uncharacterized repeat protein (TIGR01451 family)